MTASNDKAAGSAQCLCARWMEAQPGYDADLLEEVSSLHVDSHSGKDDGKLRFL